ncbi:double-stranded RNA-binding Staufen isoform X1 [Schistosoma japonicum]|uniref:Double-stranded RNA-binding Staufen isoform X1 n=2 Tax=Schistosoma japonicum TaxID=6182 RepID=A0A4Z2CYH9_SCHJA|nr:double-stranded RNA-binding Staufen isoform X1 [Schistosoma japonicum]
MMFDRVTSMNSSPVFILNKRARFLNTTLSWTCKENGPYHDKVFHVNVVISHKSLNISETYFGTGSSIKKAKRMAADTALQSCDLLKCTTESNIEGLQLGGAFSIPENVNPFIILIKCTPTPQAPNLQLRQLLNLLGSKMKLIHLEKDTSNNLNSVMYDAVAEIVGRQYVGKANTRSGAEQEACISALNAIRRSVLSYIKTQKQKKKSYYDDNNMLICQYIHPESSIWRLHILSGLHSIQPSFKIQKLENYQPCKFTCTCLLDGWKSTENLSTSVKKAQNAAAQSMLNKMNQIESKRSTIQSYENQRYVNPSKCDIHERHPKVCKVKLQLNQDRALDKSVHPICRLECFRIANNLEKVKYTLLNDQLPGGGNTTIMPGRPPFIYQIEFSNICIQGPEANNKRLAKRLAAELLLNKLELSGEKSSAYVKSVLRTKPIEPFISDAVESASKNLPCKFVSDLHCPVSAEEKLDRSPQLINEDRHVNFSCTGDILVLDDKLLDRVLLRKRISRPLKKKNIRSKLMGNDSNRRSQSSVNLSVSETNKMLRNYSPTSANSLSLNSITEPKNNSFGVFSNSIGYWIDSKKLKSNQKLCTQSHSEVNLSGDHWYLTLDSIYDKSSPDFIVACTKSNIRLQLLARVAEYCLQEHTSKISISKTTEYRTSEVTSLTDQLVFLCRRLLVPCHFIDYPPKWSITYKSGEEFNVKHYEYTVVLFIGINPMKDISIRYSKDNGYIAAKATDLTRNSARQKAAQCAVQRLAKLIN